MILSLLILTLASVSNAVLVELIVGTNNTKTYSIDSTLLRASADYYSTSLHDFRKRKRGQSGPDKLTIRHEDIEPDVFEYIFHFMESETGTFSKVPEELLLDVLIVADSLDVALSFYENLILQLSIEKCIGLVKQLWDMRESIENSRIILFSISRAIPAYYPSLIGDLSYSGYADILRIFRSIPYGSKLPETIMHEWGLPSEDTKIIDRLPAFVLMSADFLGPKILEEVVSRISTEQLIAQLAALNHALRPSHGYILDRIVAKMPEWMYRSDLSSSLESPHEAAYPRESIIVPDTHWLALVEQVNDLYGLSYWTREHQTNHMETVDPSWFKFNPEAAGDVNLILFKTSEGHVYFVIIQNDPQTERKTESFRVLLAAPRSESVPGLTFEKSEFTCLYYDDVVDESLGLNEENHLFSLYGMYDGIHRIVRPVLDASKESGKSRGVIFGGSGNQPITIASVEIYTIVH
jgi:hypothetical protein